MFMETPAGYVICPAVIDVESAAGDDEGVRDGVKIGKMKGMKSNRRSFDSLRSLRMTGLCGRLV